MTAKRASSKDLVERLVDGHRIVFDRATSKRMGGIRQRDTAPEQLVRRCLAAHGLRFRISNRDLPGSPDVANRKGRWAIFVHGCYWHRHPGCRRSTTPKRNIDFWLAKFEANVARDARAREELQARGFDVLTIWECQAEAPAELEVIVDAFVRRIGRAAEAMTRTRLTRRRRCSSASPIPPRTGPGRRSRSS